MATAPKRALAFDPKLIGKRVRALRKINGLSAEDLGLAVGMGKDNLLKKEKGGSWRLDQLSRIAARLDAPFPWPIVSLRAAGTITKVQSGLRDNEDVP